MVTCVGIAGLLGVGWMLSRPVPARIGSPPADLGATRVTITTAAGSVVHAWWCPSGNSRGAIVLLPGIRANRLSMVNRARFLKRHGYSVLLIDLQATGESEGQAITFGWREREDVRASVAFDRRGEPQRPVAIIGSSLGGAAAVLALPELKVDALILEAVYPSVERATRNRLEIRFGRIGTFAAALLLAQLQPRLGVAASQLRPIDRIGYAKCPVFIIGGASDRHTTPGDTLLLYEAAKPPKSLWLVPDAAHVDLHRAAGAEYERRVSDFLAGAFRRGTA